MRFSRGAALLAVMVYVAVFFQPGGARGEADERPGGLLVNIPGLEKDASGESSEAGGKAARTGYGERTAAGLEPEPALPSDPEVFEPAVKVPEFGAALKGQAGLADEEGETEITPQWGDVKGITIPRRPEVDAVIDEFKSVGRSTIAGSLERAGMYLPLIRRELEEMNLPPELAALAMVESHFHQDAKSGAGAAGMWQFIDSTAKNYDLRVDWWVDQRLDPVASTRAAAKHLKDLYEKFGDWSLAVAAYNAGSGGVERAMARTGLPTFWDLYEVNGLRRETRRYVAKFYAAAAILNDPEAFGFEPPEPSGRGGVDVVEVDSPVDFVTISKITGLGTKELARLNPGLKRGCTPPGAKSYELRVPEGFGETLARRLAAIPPGERLSFKRHKVARGETLWKIAKKYSVEPEAIAMLNCLKDPKKLKTGDELVVPFGGKASPEKEKVEVAQARAGGRKEGGGSRTHVVLNGDTLWSIAAKNGTTVETLCALNGLSSRSKLKIGQTLKTGR